MRAPEDRGGWRVGVAQRGERCALKLSPFCTITGTFCNFPLCLLWWVSYDALLSCSRGAGGCETARLQCGEGLEAEQGPDTTPPSRAMAAWDRIAGHSSTQPVPTSDAVSFQQLKEQLLAEMARDSLAPSQGTLHPPGSISLCESKLHAAS